MWKAYYRIEAMNRMLASLCWIFLTRPAASGATAALMDGHELVESDSLVLSAKMVDGFPRLTVVDDSGPRRRVLYVVRKAGDSVRYAIPWRFWSSAGGFSGFLVAYEYGSGSSNKITIIGPTKSGKWGELLDVDAADAYWFQPEFVDLVGDGIVDIFLITELRTPGGRLYKLGQTPVEDWRWSPKLRRYRLAAKTTYAHRFDVSKLRK